MQKTKMYPYQFLGTFIDRCDLCHSNILLELYTRGENDLRVYSRYCCQYECNLEDYLTLREATTLTIRLPGVKR